jgi:ribosomal protein S27E
MKEFSLQPFSLPRMLPAVRMHGTEYFIDERVRQFREVTKPYNFIDFDTMRGLIMLNRLCRVACPGCGQSVGIRKSGPEERVRCLRCGRRFRVPRRLG